MRGILGKRVSVGSGFGEGGEWGKEEGIVKMNLGDKKYKERKAGEWRMSRRRELVKVCLFFIGVCRGEKRR